MCPPPKCKEKAKKRVSGLDLIMSYRWLCFILGNMIERCCKELFYIRKKANMKKKSGCFVKQVKSYYCKYCPNFSSQN